MTSRCQVCGALIEVKGRRCYCDECRKLSEWKRKNYAVSLRYSGRRYKNTPDTLEAIREKYKNGIPSGTIERMVSGEIITRG